MFQVMPPQGGIIRATIGIQMVSCMFQVMPPQGGISISSPRRTNRRNVSSHAPARGHPHILRLLLLRSKFQVMPPQGGIHEDAQHPKSQKSFKSCPRKGASP